MIERCFEPDELPEVARLPAGDPRRRHLDECARCGAELAALHAFLEPRSVPSEADPADARARLAAVLEREVGPLEERAAADAPRASRRRGWLDALLAPPLRPAVAAAVVVVVAGGALLAYLAARAPDSDRRLRGEAPAAEALALEPPRTVADGIELSWSRFPAATGYRVHLYTRELDEIGSFDAGAETTLVFRAASLPGAAPGTPLLWRVAARHGRDELARSDVGRLIAP